MKNGEESEVGLVGPAEKEDAAVSVKTLDKEVLLCEWKGLLCRVKSYVSGLSLLRFSVLFLPAKIAVDGDNPPGDVGERAPGVCTFDGGFDVPSDSSAIELFLDLAPVR